MRITSLQVALSRFLKAVMKDLPYGYPAAHEEPRPAELDLLSFLGQYGRVSSDEIEPVRQDTALYEAYAFLQFSCRMAIFAARHSDVDVLQTAQIDLVIDNKDVDYREVLILLSIIEDCAIRLGTPLKAVLEEFIPLAVPARQSTIRGYLQRPTAMRGPECMGVAVTGAGGTLSYRRLPW